MNIRTRNLLIAGAVGLGLAGLAVGNIVMQGGGGLRASLASDANPACDDADTFRAVGQIETDQGQELLDIGHVTELNYSKADDVRFCEADASLNTGSTHLSYRIYHGPSGKLLIEAKEGNDAFNAFGLSTEAYSQKQYDAKVQTLRDATKEYKATHPDSPPARPDYENAPGTVPFGTPYHSGSAQNHSRTQSQDSDGSN